MSIQPWQLIQLLSFFAMTIGVWKFKNKYVRVGIMAMAFIIFAVNPIRTKQPGTASIEGDEPNFIISKRWTDESKSFIDKQKDDHDELKKESKNAMD